MSQDQREVENAQPASGKVGRSCFKVHMTLAKQGGSAQDPQEQAELLRKREERLKQRLNKALKRLYSSRRIPGILEEVEKRVAAGRSLEEIVLIYESIPRYLPQLEAVTRQVLQAVTEHSRLAPQLRDAAEQIRLVESHVREAREHVFGVDSQIGEIVMAAKDFHRLQPTVAAARDTVRLAASNLDSVAAKSISSIAAKDLSSAVAKDLGPSLAKAFDSPATQLRPLVARASATAVEAATRSFTEVDAISAALAEGSVAMSRSILGEAADLFRDQSAGYNSAAREIEIALESKREWEEAIGLDQKLETISSAAQTSRLLPRAVEEMMRVQREFAQEEQYRRSLELGPAQLTALSEIASSRDLLAAALRPFPDLITASGFPGERSAYASRAFRRLNKAIAKAPVLGEVEVEKHSNEEQSGEGTPEPGTELEQQLIKVVPAEVLTELRLPLSELDRVLRHPEAMRMLTARQFEKFIATLVEQLGFEEVTLTPPSGDQGRDLLATKRFNGMSVLFAFECKRFSPNHRVGPGIVRALLGTIMHKHTRASKGVLVTTSTFTAGARKFIVTEPNLDGRDFDGVIEWLKDYSAMARAKALE